jgi:flagellar basal body-associated protein FliL
LVKVEILNKRNSLIIISICALILNLPMAAVCNVSPKPNETGNDPAALTFSPSETIGPPPATGETFTVNAAVQNVINFFTYDITVSWNSSVLNYSGRVTYLTSFFKSTYGQGIELYSNGNITGIASSYTDGSPGVTGSGALFQITFKVIGSSPCSTWINFSDTLTEIINSTGYEIPYSVVNGYFALTSTKAPPHPTTLWVPVAVVVVVVVVLVAASTVYMRTRKRKHKHVSKKGHADS